MKTTFCCFLLIIACMTLTTGMSASAENIRVLSLDGNGDYAILPSNIFNSLDEATVEGWIRWQSFGYASKLFDFGAIWRDMSVFNGIQTNSLSFYIHLPALHAIAVNNVIFHGQWYHIAAVSGPGGMKLYLNGELIGTNSYTGSFSSIQNGDNNYIGRSNWPWDADTHGHIDEFRVWSVARTQEQIRATMNRLLVGNELGLFAYYRFDELENLGMGSDGLTDDVRDMSGNGHHADLVGDATLIPADLPLGSPVEIDIKPASCPNPLNLNSKGVLPVAILGTENFDVTQVDPASVLLEGVAPLRWDLEDVATPYDGELEDAYSCIEDGPDGFLDLTLKYNTEEVVAAVGEVGDGDILVLSLTGNLKEEFGGDALYGGDVVVVRKKGYPAPSSVHKLSETWGKIKAEH